MIIYYSCVLYIIIYQYIGLYTYMASIYIHISYMLIYGIYTYICICIYDVGSTDLFHGEILQSTSDNCHSPACLLTGGRVILYLYLLTVSHNIGCWCFENSSYMEDDSKTIFIDDVLGRFESVKGLRGPSFRGPPQTYREPFCNYMVPRG